MIGRWGVALLAAAALVFPAAADAAFPGANGKIAFERSNDIWTMNPDGSGQVNITNTASARETAPSWSADGREIAFSREGSIWIMNADGSGQSPIVPAPNDPNACGSGATVLGQGMGQPTWSPDSSRLAFHSSRGCRVSDPNFFSEWVDYDLYTANRDGTGLTRIKFNGSFPRWSPDGTKIGYTGTCQGGGCTNIWSINPDGSGDDEVWDSGVQADFFGDWSPDASLMTGCGEGPALPNFAGCYTVRRDGTAKTDLSRNVRPDVWSPDGKKFAWARFNASTGDSFNVFTGNVDGTGVTQIAADANYPDWQPIPINAYPRPRGASPLRVLLVPAYAPCTAPNRTHGAPLSFDSCSPPQRTSGQLTVGTPDANGAGARSVAEVILTTRPGSAGILADDADVSVSVSITDVRRTNLSDYGGELGIVSDLTITDKDNTPTPSGPGAATVQTAPLPITVQCSPTSDTGIGSRCQLQSSVDALIPGAVKEGRHSVWQLGPVLAYDGGPDGLVSTTAGNTLFMTQGLFIP